MADGNKGVLPCPSEGQIMSLIRPQSKELPKISSVIAALSAVPPEHLAALGAIRVADATRREALLARTLAKHYPTLQITAQRAKKTLPFGRMGGEGDKEHGEDEHIPPIEQLSEAARLIMEHGVREEGIFRLMRNLVRVNELVTAIHAGKLVNMQGDTPYDLACLLKAYTRIAFPRMLSAKEVEQTCAERSATALLESLPADRRAYLDLLINVSRAVVENTAANKMDYDALARVFAPNFFQDPDPLVEFKYIKPTIEAVAIILKHR